MTEPMRINKAQDYGKVRKNAKAQIDMRCAEARKKYLTDAHGQEYVYNEKFIEAKLWLDKELTEIGQCPFLASEATSMNISPDAAAHRIVDAKLNRDSKLAKMEHIRIAAKNAIDGAPDRLSDIWKIAHTTHFDQI